MSDTRGTYDCPICGFDQPHQHEPRDVEWYRTGVVPDGYLGAGESARPNAAQRESMFHHARSQHEWARLMQDFEADPIAVIDRGPPKTVWGSPNVDEQACWLFRFRSQIKDRLARGIAAERELAALRSVDHRGAPDPDWCWCGLKRDEPGHNH